MLEDVRGKSAEDAQRYLKTCLFTWQGDTEQTDDVCVAVFRLT
jgi:serine phosphatase RsbU (regulator of sigma subunit)